MHGRGRPGALPANTGQRTLRHHYIICLRRAPGNHISTRWMLAWTISSNKPFDKEQLIAGCGWRRACSICMRTAHGKRDLENRVLRERTGELEKALQARVSSLACQPRTEHPMNHILGFGHCSSLTHNSRPIRGGAAF